jgi:hypothetical protein
MRPRFYNQTIVYNFLVKFIGDTNENGQIKNFTLKTVIVYNILCYRLVHW